MNEVAPRSVRAESNGVKRSAQLCLVFRMATKRAQFVYSVSELALVSVFTSPVFLKRSAKFRLVPAGVRARSPTLFFGTQTQRTFPFVGCTCERDQVR